MPLKILMLAACASFALAGCTRAADDSGDAAFGAKVRAYLLQHPEVIEEAVQKLQDQKDAEAAAKTKVALKSERNAVERDPRDFVANPNGKITVTEFYDYRCPHCINAAPAVLKIIHDNPDVRVVFKELPIFGATSEHAAREAIALNNAHGDVLGFYRDLMNTKGLNDAEVDQIAKAHGLDPAKAEDASARTAEDAQIADIHTLAEKLEIDGTPTFIIGDTVVPGEDMDAVRTAIDKARSTAKAG
jgi:protein-disulfide isomerase